MVSADTHAALDPALRLDIGICSVQRDGDDVLEVGFRVLDLGVRVQDEELALL